MSISHIIVQAGGKGTRLEHLTANKPKALIPVDNLPMLFHLFRKFPDKRHIIIADYKRDVLREYLASFADVKYRIVDAEGGTGTCSGIGQAVALLPDGEPFMLIWSDLILPDGFCLPNADENRVGLSETFPCRWSCRDGKFEESVSVENGVAGLFVFKDKSVLNDVPQSGEFVRWLKEREIAFETFGLAGTREFGLLSEYEKLGRAKTRPFNRITIEGETVVKEAADEQGRRLAEREANWYDFAASRGVTAIPKIYATKPLKMERIDGGNVYEPNLLQDEKRNVLERIAEALKDLHKLGRAPADAFSLHEAYYTKTMDRLGKVRDLLPFADRRTIVVNGRACRNVFFCKRALEERLARLRCDAFAFIHGDCTFSNIMIRKDGRPIFIDPRGYFGFTELFGDPNYDWAKLYYSLVGNYDRFNLKDFRLTIREDDVLLRIASNGWESLESDFFALTKADEATIKLLHAVIWLSLTTYAWQDCDSICGAFYNGIYYLEEIL
jgi:GTP:adenosylcobinamide-phosphate guanylyltransferase/aminoglycoside phosphotransferase